jgi:hypothetical protein
LPRSSAYWSANLYQDPDQEPKRAAPLRDLPEISAARFRALREGLLDLTGITERVRFMGDQWRWAWEYGLPGRRLCWLHVMDTGIGGTYTISDETERGLITVPRLSAVIAKAYRDGQQVGPVRWCWIEFVDRRSVEAFLGFMKKKAAVVRALPPENRIFGRSRAG